MADHSELVAEMLILEQMGTQERQKLAKKRRLQQIKKWNQREKEWMAKEKQMNKRLANKINEENNGLNLKHYTQYSTSEKSPNIRSTTTTNQTASATNKSYINNNNIITNNNYDNNSTKNGIIKYKQNNVKSSGPPSNINNNIMRKNPNNNVNSKTGSLNGLDCQDLCPRSINSKVHFDSGVMLLEAAARNDLNEVKRLLMLGVSPDSKNHDGLTTLHQGCIEASEPMINLLLEFGANVDARDTEQWTPLHAACTCGHLNLVKLLVERGADLLAINGDGNMPFDLCEDEQTLDYLESQMVAKGITQEMIDLARVSTEMQMISEIQRLINNGIDIRKITYANNVTPAHVAAANGYLSALKFLIKNGADMTAQDNDLWQPLHGVACWGNEQHIKIIELLIEAGANLEAKTINDETVFDLCDNEHILEKLHEIRDEIESKQAASEADKLKRTQSRTNSRIHSIRRTSTRDKGQISRRDAREEALLRSESSGALPNINNVDNHPLNDMRLGGIDNDVHPLKAMDNQLSGHDQHDGASDSNDILKDDVIIRREQQLSKTTSGLVSETTMRQDSGIETSYLSADLDAQQTTIRSTSATNISSNNKNNHQQSSPHSANNSTHQNGSQQQNNHQNGINHQNKSQISFNSTNGQLASDATTNEVNYHEDAPNDQFRVNSHSGVLRSTANQELIMNDRSLSSSKTNEMINNNNNRRASLSYHSSIKGPNQVGDQTTSYESNQPTITTTVTSSGSKVVVQFNSSNYTLSNLKKQRSDFRMRTSSLGCLDVDGSGLSVNDEDLHSGVGGGASFAYGEHRSDTSSVKQEHTDLGSQVVGTKKKWSITGNGPAGVVPSTKMETKNSANISNNPTTNHMNKNNNGKIKNNKNNSQFVDERPLQSPTSSLRRFRGEPSEFIGGDERGAKHNCCSII